MTPSTRAEGAERACKTRKEELVQIGQPDPQAYWKSLEQLHGGQKPSAEFAKGLPSAAPHGDDTRRDFLSLMGFTVAAAGLAGCRAPVQQAIPMLVGSDQIVPGVSSWYATTCGGCPSSCSLLVKQRDGRPIKIEGNEQSVLFGGGTCATGQATVLSLYDGERLRGPVWNGESAEWRQIDQRVSESLSGAERSKREIVLLSGTITSPSMLEIVADWSKRY